MKNYKKHNCGMSRREFLRKGVFVVGGAFACAYGVRGKATQANTPGVTGNRVVWVNDVNATFWNGSTGYYGDYVDQVRVNAMIERGIKTLTGESSVFSAWQRIIPNYSTGEKIVIKVNINNSSSGNAIDATPGSIIGVIAGLKSIGVSEPDIYVIEPSREFSSRIASPILTLYPNVQFWDSNGSQGHQVTFNYSPSANTTIDHSNPRLTGDNNYSYLPEQLGAATYLISMPIMKGHGVAEISLTFKNHFGSLKKWTCAKLHDYALPFRAYYSYDMNPLHDIYLNTNIKDKTVLIVGDGLFCSRTATEGIPQVWNTFGGKFPNSIFLSTDPVAIDSVMFDFLNAEVARSSQSQLYLHRAVELGLGTHEHWNNATQKRYSVIDFVQVDMGNLDILPPAPPKNLRIF